MIKKLAEIQTLVQEYFGSKALYRGTVRHDPDRDREDGYVRFLLYDSLTFGFGYSGAPYASLSCFYESGQQSTTTSLLGVDLTFIENNSDAIEQALAHVNRYCRLRLPDKFLAAFDEVI